jgi:hypothetical protein
LQNPARRRRRERVHLIVPETGTLYLNAGLENQMFCLSAIPGFKPSKKEERESLYNRL